MRGRSFLSRLKRVRFERIFFRRKNTTMSFYAQKSRVLENRTNIRGYSSPPRKNECGALCVLWYSLENNNLFE